MSESESEDEAFRPVTGLRTVREEVGSATYESWPIGARMAIERVETKVNEATGIGLGWQRKHGDLLQRYEGAGKPATPAKAYLVWTGSYSDKAVVAVCTTQERADAIAKWILEHDSAGRTKAEADAFGVDWFCADSDARVTEVEMDVAVPGSDGRVPYSVGFDAHGNVTNASRTIASGVDPWLDPPYIWGPWCDGRMEAQVRAADEKHAVKIAVDLRAARLALGGSR